MVIGARTWLAIATAAASALSYAAVTLSARLLGPADFGLLGALVAIVSFLTALLSPLAGLATHVGATALTGQHAPGVSRLSGPILVAGTALGLISLLVVGASAGLLNEFLHTAGWLPVLLLAPFVAALTWVQLLKGLLSGLQRFGAFAAATTLEPFVRATLTLPLVVAFGVSGGLGAYLAGVVAAVMLSIGTLGGPGWKVPAGKQLVRPSRTAVATALLTVVVAILQSGDVIVLRWYAEPGRAGLYAAAAALGNAMFTLVAPLMLPAFSRTLAAAERSERTLPILVETLTPVSAIGLLATAAAFTWGGVAQALIFGPSFSGLDAVLGPYFVKTSIVLIAVGIGQYAVVVAGWRALAAAVVPASMGPLVLLLVQPGPQGAALTMTLAAAAAVAPLTPLLRRGSVPRLARY